MSRMTAKTSKASKASSRAPTRRRFLGEFIGAVREGPRLYFAPLIGAIRAIRREWLNTGRE